MTENPRSGAINPLRALREAEGVPRLQFASFLGTSKATVQFAEEGCFSTIPLAYRPHLVREDFLQYQEFRVAKRRANFPDPAKLEQCESLREVLEVFNLSPYQFAERACLQPSEVWRALNKKRTCYPKNLIQFFQTIGCSATFVARFEV